MSISRTRSLSFDALYRPIPQGPETLPLDHDQVEEDVENSQPRITPSTGILVDSKIVWIHFILGSSVLLPWNVSDFLFLWNDDSNYRSVVVITATPYFMKRFEGSGLEHTFSSYLSTTFTASNFIFLAHATVTSKHVSPSSCCLLIRNQLWHFRLVPPRERVFQSTGSCC